MNKQSLFLVLSFLSALGLTLQSSEPEIFPFAKIQNCLGASLSKTLGSGMRI